MIAVRLLTQEEIAERLESSGCQSTGDVLKNAALWVTAWNHHFFVPQVGPDKMCAEYVLEIIIEKEVEGTRPSTH